ncbi:MAG: helix-turn-helix transcriptional regulator [Anaerolineales bacterium]|nr:helix-turn-helix transcriptional regulator [Anaerolineales bacterium]
MAILTILREGEQCVCHIEAMLKLRQAYISQHLMVLKDAEIIADRRDGWNIYYRVVMPEIFEIMNIMFLVSGRPDTIDHAHAKANCPCPKCHPEKAQPPDKGVILSSE